MFSSPETVEAVVAVMGIAGAGWSAYIYSEKRQIEKSIQALKESESDQWKRMEAMRVETDLKIQRSITDVKTDIKEVMRAVERLADKLDNAVLRGGIGSTQRKED